MSSAIVSGIFGAVIAGLLIYVIQRIDQLSGRITEQGLRLDARITEQGNRLDARITEQGERLARIEGKLDEHLREHS